VDSASDREMAEEVSSILVFEIKMEYGLKRHVVKKVNRSFFYLFILVVFFAKCSLELERLGVVCV
jgi:hypothetical protein